MNLLKIFGLKTQSFKAESGVLGDLILERVESALGVTDVAEGIDCAVKASVLLDGIITHFNHLVGVMNGGMLSSEA